MPNRSEVYEAIDSEREHQIRRWGDDKTNGLGSYLVFMQSYLNEAIQQLTHSNSTAKAEEVLVTLRKIVALGVACMEKFGAPEREVLYGVPFEKHIFADGKLYLVMANDGKPGLGQLIEIENSLGVSQDVTNWVRRGESGGILEIDMREVLSRRGRLTVPHHPV